MTSLSLGVKRLLGVPDVLKLHQYLAKEPSGANAKQVLAMITERAQAEAAGVTEGGGLGGCFQRRGFI